MIILIIVELVFQSWECIICLHDVLELLGVWSLSLSWGRLFFVSVRHSSLATSLLGGLVITVEVGLTSLGWSAFFLVRGLILTFAIFFVLLIDPDSLGSVLSIDHLSNLELVKTESGLFSNIFTVELGLFVLDVFLFKDSLLNVLVNA